MSKPIKQMDATELKQEILMLRVLESSLQRCMEEDPGFTDDNAVQLLHDTKDSLAEAQAEEWNRGTQAYKGCT